MAKRGRGGKREGAGRKSKIAKASEAAENDSYQRKLSFGFVDRRNTARGARTQQNQNLEQSNHQENEAAANKSSNDRDNDEQDGDAGLVRGNGKNRRSTENRQREIDLLWEKYKYFPDGVQLDPEDLEDEEERLREEEKVNSRKSRMRYQPPAESILGQYLQKKRIELTSGDDTKIESSPRWILSEHCPSADPYNPANYYLENVTIYLHDPVVQNRNQLKKQHRDFQCVHCGCKGKLSCQDWFYRPAHHGDTTDWILHRRYHCKGTKKDKGCGKTFASFHPDFLKQFPEYVADSFPFVMTGLLGMHESMVHQMLFLSTKGVLFGAFSRCINETKMNKYWKQHGCYMQHVDRRVTAKRQLNITTDYMETPFASFDSAGEYNGIELQPALLRRIFIMMMMVNEDYMQESFQLILGKSESPDHTFRFPKMIRCFKLGGKCYNATYDSINEFGEPTMNIFCHTKANDELKPAIMDNKRIREETGGPDLLRIESDGGGDSAVWHEVFHDNLVKRTNPYKPLWRKGLPRAELPDNKIEKFTSAASLDTWIISMLDKVEDYDGPIYYGLDSETDYDGRTKLIQLCLPTNLFPKVVVVDLGKIGVIGRESFENKLKSFKFFLENKKLIPVAVNVTYDLRKLNELGVDSSNQSAIELMHLASQLEPNHPEGYSLQKICARTLGIYVPKELQHNSWETITDELVQYAALDAYLHLLVYQKLEKALNSTMADGEVSPVQSLINETGGNRVRVLFNGDTFGFGTLDFVGGRDGEIRKFDGYTIGKGQCIVVLDELSSRTTAKPKNGFRIITNNGARLETIRGSTIGKVFKQHAVDGKLNLIWEIERVNVVLESGDGAVASNSYGQYVGRCLRKCKRRCQPDDIHAKTFALDESELLVGDKIPIPKSNPTHPRTREKRDRFHLFQAFPSSRDKDIKARLIIIRRMAFQALTLFDAEDLLAIHKYLQEEALVDNWDDVIDYYFFNKEWWYERVRMYPPDAERGVQRLKRVVKYIHEQPELKDYWELVEKWFDSAMELSERGHLEETPDVCMFQWKGRDRNGLNLYFRRRGSNRSELLHQKMRIALGAHGVGAEVGHFLILWITYRFKVRSGITRRWYHDFGMFNLRLIDRIQNMYKSVFSRDIFPKHRNQMDAKVIKGLVMVGIRPLNYNSEFVKQGAPHKSLNGDLKFMAKRSGVQCIPTPIATRKEKAILANFIGTRQKPNKSQWIELATVFARQVDYKQVFPKLPSMLRSYFNKWKVTQGIKCIQLHFKESMYGVLAELMQVEQNESAVVCFQRMACNEQKKAENMKPMVTTAQSNQEKEIPRVCQPVTYGPKLPGLNDLNDRQSDGGLCVGAFLGCNKQGCITRMKNIARCPFVQANKIPVDKMDDLKRRKADFDKKRRAQIASLKRRIQGLEEEADARRKVDQQQMGNKNSHHTGDVSYEVKNSLQVFESSQGVVVEVKLEKTLEANTSSAIIHNEDFVDRPTLQREKAEANPSSATIIHDEDLVDRQTLERERVVAQLGNQLLQAQSLERLRDGCWLNDEVINFWFERLGGGTNSLVHFMTSQFMTTLLRQPSRYTEPRFENYKYHDNVDSWLKVDLFAGQTCCSNKCGK